jgi:hypothetical protein
MRETPRMCAAFDETWLAGLLERRAVPVSLADGTVLSR